MPSDEKASQPVAIVVVDAGVCGHSATIRAERTSGYNVRLTVESDCAHVRSIAPEPLEVDALREVATRTGLPPLLERAHLTCAHAACPVPSALIKAAEVATGLALPKDVTIRISSSPEGEG